METHNNVQNERRPRARRHSVAARGPAHEAPILVRVSAAVCTCLWGRAAIRSIWARPAHSDTMTVGGTHAGGERRDCVSASPPGSRYPADGARPASIGGCAGGGAV